MDNISEWDREFSYHLAAFRPAEEDSRLDYRYDPAIARGQRKGGLDCSFLLNPDAPKLAPKMEESGEGESFMASNPPMQEDSEDFFDFLESKPKPR